jgi:parallel beta-helix repeat protein
MGIFLDGFNNNICDNSITNNTLALLPYRFPDRWPNWPRALYNTDFWVQMIWLSSGLALFRGGNNTIESNEFLSNDRGIFLWSTPFNKLRANNMAGDIYNLAIEPTPLCPPSWYNPPVNPQISPYFMQDIDVSNTVDGKPVYWLINVNDLTIPEDAGYVALINATHVTVQNLALQNNTQGILLVDAKNVTVSGNTVQNAMYGIFAADTIPVNQCGNNTLELNNVTDSGVGVYSSQPRSEISYNRLARNLAGIFDGGDGNLIRSNVITDNIGPPNEEWILGYLPLHLEDTTAYNGLGLGLVLGNSNGTISGNTISYNEIGVNADPYQYVNNTIFNNNFINNVHLLNPRLGHDTSMNSWDGGYPAGGNYWGESECEDVFSGLYQNVTGSDGISDSPRYVVWNKTDNYPLVAPIKTFRVETRNNTFIDVSIVSNSTISDFQLDNSSKTIRFNVFGEYGAGFCRLDVPSQILEGFFHGNYTVSVDGNPVEFGNWTDENHTYIYFTYRHSEHEVTVIPEYQLLTPLLVIMATAMIASIVEKRLRRRASSEYL